MTEGRGLRADLAAAPEADKPHVFEEVDQLPMSAPRADDTGGARYDAPPTPAGTAMLCGLCRRSRTDRIHIEGEAEADAESPHWGL